MAAECSFKKLVGGRCGFGSQDRDKRHVIIPLVSCKKDISSHAAALSFVEPSNEIDLILCRAGVFSRPQDLENWTICSLHRYNLGVGWSRGGNTRCRVPCELSKHLSSRRGKWPKAEKGLSKKQSQMILKKTGIFTPVGSGKFSYFFMNGAGL